MLVPEGPSERASAKRKLDAMEDVDMVGRVAKVVNTGNLVLDMQASRRERYPNRSENEYGWYIHGGGIGRREEIYTTIVSREEVLAYISVGEAAR